MEIFNHHIYEYKKGLRNLILLTTCQKKQDKIKKRLSKENIDYVIHKIKGNKINVYFGDKNCIDIVKSFNESNLSKLNNEQDFILGIMLGYDRLMQCERYLEKTIIPTSL